MIVVWYKCGYVIEMWRCSMLSVRYIKKKLKEKEYIKKGKKCCKSSIKVSQTFCERRMRVTIRWNPSLDRPRSTEKGGFHISKAAAACCKAVTAAVACTAAVAVAAIDVGAAVDVVASSVGGGDYSC
jgi:hypothetical protein